MGRHKANENRATHLVPVSLENRMRALDRAGFSLVPLGGGEDGKSPIRPFANRVIPLSESLSAMAAKGSWVYGIRLDGLVVLDTDEASPDLIAALSDRFGHSPVIVQTRRGFHLYFRAPERARLPNLRGEGLPVDVKSGRNEYVIGPGSIRPDGTEYQLVRGDPATDALPFLRLPVGEALAPSNLISEGARHSALVQKAIELVRAAASREAFLFELLHIRDRECDRPETMPDSEVAGIAEWAWQKRLDNQLWSGANSGFRLNRLALEALRGNPRQDQALGLFALLSAEHGHIDRPFVLDHQRMREAGLTSMGRESFLAARRALEAAGLLRRVRKGRKGVTLDQWRLSTPSLGGEAVAYI